MELKIISPTPEGFVKAIEWNHEEIKREMEAKVADYKSIIYDDTQIKEAKADRAELNKLKSSLEAKRKEIKEACLAPYNSFEKQMKELVAIVDEPIQIIDAQVKQYESEQKALKLNQIRAHFESLDFSGIEFYQVENPKWLNATTSLKSVYEELDKKAEEIKADIAIINDLKEYAFEALETYKASLDLKAALTTAKTLEETAKRKAEAQRQAEEAQKAQEEAKATQTENETPEEVKAENEPQEEPQSEENFMPDFDTIEDNRHWATIKIFTNPEVLNTVKIFLEDRHAQFEIIGGLEG